MKKDDRAVCQETGVERNVTDDSPTNWCEMNHKRVDSAWSPWESSVITSTAEEWKEIRTRYCVGFVAHGGRECTGRSEEILEWLKFEKIRITWEGARRFCEASDGELFYNVDGTIQQLIALTDKLEGAFWTGIRGSKGKWKGLDGQLIPEERLFWQLGWDFSSAGDSPNYVVGNKNGLFDLTPANNWYFFICDMS